MKLSKMKNRLIALTLIVVSLILSYPSVGVNAKSNKKTIYVISEITEIGNVSTKSEVFEYNKNGLLKKRNNGISVINYSYDGKNIIKSKNSASNTGRPVPEGAKKTQILTYKYDKAGRYSQITDKINKDEYTYKYFYGNKKLKSIKEYRSGYKDVILNCNIYYNKKNRIEKTYIKHAKDEYKTFADYEVNYSYDSKGNITKKLIKSIYPNATLKNVFKYTYTINKAGNITKIKEKSNARETTYKIKYKKIDVQTSYADTVEHQQNALISQIIESDRFYNPASGL